MKLFIKTITEMVNIFHDILETVVNKLGFSLTDKDLHFWVIGLLGIVGFVFIHIIFKKLALLSITSISFIYTFTVVLVVVFAIEIEQGITNRGHMELADALIGLYGFIAFFVFYLLIVMTVKGIRHLIRQRRKNHSSENKRYYE